MKIKKILLALTCVALAATTFAACGNTTSSSDASSTASSEASSEAKAIADEITVVSREEGSGTRGAFVELLGVEIENAEGKKVDATTVEAIVVNSTNSVMTTVAGNDSAIGYISLGSLNDTVKALKVDGVEATVANIKDGSYKVARPFNIAVKGEASEVAQDFINFILSAEGQAIVTDNKYITAIDNAPAFKGEAVSGKISIAGSTSVGPLMEKLAEAYNEINANVEIDIQQNGSSAGMTAAMEGTCDIGMASRELKDSEKAELTPTVIANDGIAVVVNKANSIADISSENITKIFLGETLKWSDVK